VRVPWPRDSIGKKAPRVTAAANPVIMTTIRKGLLVQCLAHIRAMILFTVYLHRFSKAILVKARRAQLCGMVSTGARGRQNNFQLESGLEPGELSVPRTAALLACVVQLL
jgi:hypothetical protein